MDETPAHAADLLSAVAAALTNEEIIKHLDVLFSRRAAIEEKIAVLLAEVSRQSSLPTPHPT